MKTWQDLKDHFKDSYRMTQALEDLEANGMVNKGALEASTLAGVLAKAFSWDKDDYLFWETVMLGLTKQNK